jgi:hypothetical protein
MNSNDDLALTRSLPFDLLHLHLVGVLLRPLESLEGLRVLEGRRGRHVGEE